jgi:hypothetical protein
MGKVGKCTLVVVVCKGEVEGIGFVGPMSRREDKMKSREVTKRGYGEAMTSEEGVTAYGNDKREVVAKGKGTGM